MARWLVKLDGEPFDLEEYPRWFPSGDAYALTISGETFLTGEVFNRFETPGQVRDAAIQILDEFSSVIALLWPGLRRPRIDQLVHENDEGVKKNHCLLSVATGSMRSKLGAVSVVVSGTGEAASEMPTQAQQLLGASRKDRRLQLVLSIWADPIRTWPRLYRLLEELEAFLGKKVDEACFCTKSERNRFTRSANSAEIAGNDARHSGGKFNPPMNPMTLEDATLFIGQLIVAVLRKV